MGTAAWGVDGRRVPGGLEDHAAVSDQTRPLLLSYFRMDLLLAGSQLADIKERLASFASTEGYTLGTVFVERSETAPAAFRALIDAAWRSEAAAVVVPGLHHFAFIGSPSTTRNLIEHFTGARVLAVMTAFT